MAGKLIGRITHFYSNIGVAVVKLTDKLAVGDKVQIVGHGADFQQNIDSIQIEHQSMPSAKEGDVIGLKVAEKVKEGAEIYKI